MMYLLLIPIAIFIIASLCVVSIGMAARAEDANNR